jgi:NADH dehydrogenase
MLYRSYQARLHGLLNGTLLWLVDTMNQRVRPSARLT